MKEEFVKFLIQRIGKKLGDITDAVDPDELNVHVEDIHDYLAQITQLITEFIHLTF
jgi:hypothetical protein